VSTQSEVVCFAQGMCWSWGRPGINAAFRTLFVCQRVFFGRPYVSGCVRFSAYRRMSHLNPPLSLHSTTMMVYPHINN